MTVKKYKTYSGAGESKSYNELQGPAPGLHWYRLTEQELRGQTNFLPYLWVEAIQNPGCSITNVNGFLYFDRDRLQVLAPELQCPSAAHHHLYQTCWRCGQYG